MKDDSNKRAVEMTGYGKRGKPNPGFPSFPTALGNRCAIPTFPPPRRLVMFQTLKTKTQESLDRRESRRGWRYGFRRRRCSIGWQYNSSSVEEQIRHLQEKKANLQAAIDDLLDAARRIGIEPGQLR